MNRFHPNMVASLSCVASDLLSERGGVSPLVLPRVSHDNLAHDEEYSLKNHPAHAGRSPRPRTGATLVEVLMALLIMAVGVTSVFTLFPISILKAIKANQTTNGKLYESAIKDTLLTHLQLWTGAPEWSENTRYGSLAATATVQDRWVTPRPVGRMMPDTNQLFRCAAATPATSGSRVPEFVISTNWSVPLGTGTGGYQNVTVASPAADGGLTWTPYRHSGYLANPLYSSYVVDPLGWNRVVLPADQRVFGRINNGDSSSALNMDRIHCQISSSAADGVFALPDSWNVVLESTPVVVSVPSASRVRIAFPETIDIAQQGRLDRIRVVLTSTLSHRGVSLLVQESSTAAAPTYPAVAGYSAIEVNGVLPAGFTAADFEQARIEIQSPSRYSWLMSVHSGPRGEFDAQCAVVFNRTFETLDEQGYRAEFCITETTDTMWANGRVDTNIAKVRWPYYNEPLPVLPTHTVADSPRIKEGGYIFDASFGYWYKIQKIEVNEERVDDVTDAPNAAGLFVRSIMTLSDPVQVSSGTVFTDYLADGTNDCQAVLMPGVIHVFTPDVPQ